MLVAPCLSLGQLGSYCLKICGNCLHTIQMRTQCPCNVPTGDAGQAELILRVSFRLKPIQEEATRVSQAG